MSYDMLPTQWWPKGRLDGIINPEHKKFLIEVVRLGVHIQWDFTILVT